MATIKIDRGFTQKIQAKGMIHSPGGSSSLPPKPPQKPKKKPPVVLVAVIAVAVLAGVVGIVLGTTRKGKAAPQADPRPVAVRPAVVQGERGQIEASKEPDRASAAQDAQTEEAPVRQAEPPKPSASAAKRVERAVPPGSAHGLRCDYYANIDGKPVRALREADAYPSNPDRSEQIGDFDLSENVGDRYGVRIRGYLVPPVSGAYRFSVCADDAAEFWLSDDATPDRLLKRVAYEGCILKGHWADRAQQQSEACDLVAGRRYYLEALLKENTGCDYLAVAWEGPVSKTYQVIEAAYLIPWSEEAAAEAQSLSRSQASEQAGGGDAVAAVREAVAEQQRSLGAAYRYAEVAETLKQQLGTWTDPDAKRFAETAVLRYVLLARLRTFVQDELAKRPVRGVWTAFGAAADVTTASDEGVTVAPGRIVAWHKVPADQFLRLVHAIVPKASVDPQTKGALCLAAAVFCQEGSGGLDLALKYRGHAVAAGGMQPEMADRILGGTPEALRAEQGIATTRAELERVAADAAELAGRLGRQKADYAAVSGSAPGAFAQYWENISHGSLKEAVNKGVLNNPPDSQEVLSEFETPRNRAENFIARVRGWVSPPETGDYYFYIAADDEGELWLSPDETPEKKSLCVRTTAFCLYRTWDKEKHRSKPVRLEKGRSYYAEALMREGQRSDHLSIAWSPVASDTPELISSSCLTCSAREAFSPAMRERSQRIEAMFRDAGELLAEAEKARRADLPDAPSATAANALQKRLEDAKQSLRQAEELLKRCESEIPQLKTAAP